MGRGKKEQGTNLGEVDCRRGGQGGEEITSDPVPRTVSGVGVLRVQIVPAEPVG